MKKLSTLYKKDPNDLGRVIDEVTPENEWVFKQVTEFYYAKNSNDETYSIKEIESQYVMKFRVNI